MFLSYLCCMLWRILSMISSLSINWIYIYFFMQSSFWGKTILPILPETATKIFLKYRKLGKLIKCISQLRIAHKLHIKEKLKEKFDYPFFFWVKKKFIMRNQCHNIDYIYELLLLIPQRCCSFAMLRCLHLFVAFWLLLHHKNSFE